MFTAFAAFDVFELHLIVIITIAIMKVYSTNVSSTVKVNLNSPYLWGYAATFWSFFEGFEFLEYITSSSSDSYSSDSLSLF